MRKSPIQRYVLPTVVVAGVAWAGFVVSRYNAPPFIAWSVIVGLLLLTAPILGLYLKRCPGRPTHLGLLLLMCGASLLACLYPTAILLQFVPGLFRSLNVAILMIGIIGVGSTAIGFLVFGIANLTARLLPRWNGLPLLLAALPIATALPQLIPAILNGRAMQWIPPQINLVAVYAFLAGWLMLAYTVWSDDRLGESDGRPA